MTRRPVLVGVFAALLGCGAIDARAQTRTQNPSQPDRFELAIGGLWTGPTSYGTRDATLTTSSGGPYRLFTTSTDLAAGGGLEASVGFRVAPRVQVALVGSYVWTSLRTSISGDVEGASAVTAVGSVAQVTAGGSVVVDLRKPSRRTAPVPFFRGAVGYLWQIHEDRALVETGLSYDVGGGVRFHLGSTRTSRGRLREFGIRAEGRAAIRSSGLAIDGKTHVSPVAAGLFFVRL